MQLYGCHFEYAGVDSSLYGLIFVNIDTSRMFAINGSTSSDTIFSNKGKKNYFIGYNYTDYPVAFDAEVSTEDGMPFLIDHKRTIENWLFGQTKNCKLYIDDADDPEGFMHEVVDGTEYRSYFNCRFVNPEQIEGNGGIVGYKFTVECDSGMLWQDPMTITSTDSSFSVNVDSDAPFYTYPDVTINMGSTGGNIQVINHTDSDTRFTTFMGLAGNTSVVMKGNINYISNNNYTKFADKNFIRLKSGLNNITFKIIGDSIFEDKYHESASAEAVEAGVYDFVVFGQENAAHTETGVTLQPGTYKFSVRSTVPVALGRGTMVNGQYVGEYLPPGSPTYLLNPSYTFTVDQTTAFAFWAYRPASEGGIAIENILDFKLVSIANPNNSSITMTWQNRRRF